MPTIIIKRPQSNPQIIEVISKNLADLYQELNIRANHEPIGIGLVMITQSLNEFDEPNLVYEGKGILGTAYVVRATKNRIVDVKEDDVEYFLECVDVYKIIE